jgi:hypothetical protein
MGSTELNHDYVAKKAQNPSFSWARCRVRPVLVDLWHAQLGGVATLGLEQRLRIPPNPGYVGLIKICPCEDCRF